MKRIAARVGLVLLGLVFALSLLELALRLVWEPDGFPERSRAFAEAVLETDATLHHRARPNVATTVAGVEYRFDGRGLRVDSPPEERRPTVLALGDSVTMGWGVPFADSWPTRFAATRDGALANGALLGWGVEQYAARLAELGPALKPKLVLVGYFPNDAEPVEDNAGLSSSGLRLWRFVGPRLRAIGVKLGLSETAVDHYRALHAPGSATWQAAVGALERIGETCRGLGARCVLVLLPALQGDPYPLADVHQRLAAAGADAGLEVVDLAPAVAGHAPTSLWVADDDPHPNAEGHRLLAERLLEALQ